MLLVLEIIAGLFLLGVAAVAVFIAMQPKHKFVFDVAKRTKAELAGKTDDKLCFNVDVRGRAFYQRRRRRRPCAGRFYAHLPAAGAVRQSAHPR